MNEPLSQLSEPTITKDLESGVPCLREKRLVEYAAEYPFFVLQEVFKIEKLEQLKQYCSDWFNVSLVAESVYCEEDSLREALYSLYRALPPLMEALYIIYKRHLDDKHKRPVSKMADVDALRNAPKNKIELLTRDQISNPAQVVYEFCGQFTAGFVRQELWDWLNAGMCYTGEYPDDLHEVALLHTYDDVLCLTEVGYELSKREAKKQVPAIEVKEDNTGGLEKVIAIIKDTCNPDKIFLLYEGAAGNETYISEYNFLTLLPGSSRESHKEYHSAIEEKCNGWASVTISFNRTTEAYKFLQNGHLFYSVMCKPGKIVYDSGKENLPAINSFDTKSIIQNARNLYAAENKKANDFLEGARYYHATRKLNCAAFLLHQAAERVLIGFLFSLTGHSYFTHNLFSLLQKTKSFTNGLAATLPQHPEKEKNLLVQLNKAYTHTRYRNDYKINSEQVAVLLKKVQALKKAAAQAVEEQLIGFEKLFQS